MIQFHEMEQRLTRAGLRTRFRGRPEIKELCNILTPDESIAKAVHGRYDGGFALLVATDRRILLIDKKPFFLNMEDVGYDMVTEVNFNARLLEASVFIITNNKQLRFNSMRQSNLRELTSLVQQRIMELRHLADSPAHHPQQPFTQPMTLTFDPVRQTYVLTSDETAVQPGMPVSFQGRQPRQAMTSPSSVRFRRRVSRFYPSSY